MPNHVQNRIEIIGTEEQVSRVLAFIKNEPDAIDFNSIIPQPVGINKTVSGHTPETKEKEWMWMMRYGYKSWYEWCVKNWGTKWNAYNINQYDNIIEFQTAWSPPHPIVERLSILFPEVEFNHKWADEDTGYNCGEYHYSDRELQIKDLPDGGSYEAYLLAFELRPFLKEYYEIVDGEYRYKD